MSLKMLHVVGARPNFMKAAPVLRALASSGNIEQLLVHTGQHYDRPMSDLILQQLQVPQPDVNLGVGSATHTVQTAEVMTRLEPVLSEARPDVVIVYGDVNSTMAATITAAKLEIPVAHVEAGLRSYDRSMPEEINRMITDRLAQVLLTPSADADENLLREGTDPATIHRVGNVMIDSLIRCLPIADAREVLTRLGCGPDDPFVLVTLHRPATVDDPALLREMMDALSALAADIPVVVPLHPRTRARLDPQWTGSDQLKLLGPLGYLEFLDLERKARLVVTDSGGVQEETTYLGVPCITVRDNTERPITTTVGTNLVVGRDPRRMLSTARTILRDGARPHQVPELWDGRAAERIAEVLARRSAFCPA